VCLTFLASFLVSFGVGWYVTGGPPNNEAVSITSLSENEGSPSASPSNWGEDDNVAASRADTERAGEEQLTRCRRLFSREVDVLDAAAASMDQWRLHIAAMNDLVAGRITLEQANKFWESTRVGALRNVAQFKRADTSLRGAGLGCTVPTDAAATKRVRDTVTECMAATLRYAATIDVARDAVGTWLHHIHEMEALRNGQATPQQALNAWLRKWRLGAQQLRTYDARTAEALTYSCS